MMWSEYNREAKLVVTEIDSCDDDDTSVWDDGDQPYYL